MKYHDADGNVVNVPKGKCWNGLPVNTYTDEQRAEVGLFPVPVPVPIVPTEAELAQQELSVLDGVLSRSAEDILDALISKGILTGNEPELTYVMQNKSLKVTARGKL